MRSRPRVFAAMEESVEDWLTHQAWLIRKEELLGTEDGTPLEAEVVFGPYAAFLSEPHSTEERQPDRTTEIDARELGIACDVRPVVPDIIHVQREGRTFAVCHVGGTVEPRVAAWGEIPLYHLTISLYEEF